MRRLRALPCLVAAALAAGLTASCKDEVLVVIAVSSVEVRGPGGPVVVGQTAQFTAVPKDDRGNTLKNRTVTWSSSNPGAATVDGSGLVRALVGGTTVITATVEGVSGSVNSDVNNPTPSVGQTDPAAVVLGSTNPQLRVLGTGFVPGAIVRWNNADRPTVYVSVTELRVTLTTADAATAGTQQLSVLNPAPGGGASAGRAVNVEYPTPTIASINPTGATVQGATFTLTVTGTGFFSASRVRFRGTERTTTFVNSTTLQASIPASEIAAPGYAQVTVVNPTPGGGTSAASDFAVRINATGLQRIAAGYQHTCAVTAGGTAYCWGRNLARQLGDGSTTDRLQPAAVVQPAGSRFVSVAAGVLHACGLDETGRAYCWGENSGGALGSAAPFNSDPAPVSGNRSYTAIDAGRTTCAVEFGGAAWCWGSNFRGALGNGGAGSSSNVPVAVAGGLSFRSVGVGDYFACGLTVAGAVYCWGSNDYGQIGNGTTTDQSVPTQVSSGLTFTFLTVGDYHACGIATTGVLYCWGFGVYGMLGDGTGNSRTTPVAVVGIGNITYAHAGRFTTCAINTIGVTYCWGAAYYGQLGDGSTDPRSAPIQVPGLGAARQIAVGENHVCALLLTGEINCWGLKSWGELGINARGAEQAPVAVSGGPAAFQRITAGGNFPHGFSCGTATTGTPYCWGNGSSGQLGNSSFGIRNTPGAMAAYTFDRIDAGSAHACAVTPTAQALCWGDGGNGQLGDGTTSSRSAPTPVSGGNVYIAISAGGAHTCAINTTGRVVCWGYNQYGQIGNGVIGGNVLTPTLAGTPVGLTFVSVSAGNVHTCAVASNGRVYCWGANFDGQLGIGSTTNQATPALVAQVTDARTVAAGWYNSCVTTTSGTAWCWGFGGGGELGQGQYASSTVPVAVISQTFKTIAIWRQLVCGVAANDAAYCWGYAQFRQGGTTGTSDFTNTPAAVAGGLTFAWVEPGYSHTCGITLPGKAYCWGLNTMGELGTGVFGVQFNPALVQGGVSFEPSFAARSRSAFSFGSAAASMVSPSRPADSVRPCAEGDDPVRCPPHTYRPVSRDPVTGRAVQQTAIRR